jgi:hypothetical protein
MIRPDFARQIRSGRLRWWSRFDQPDPWDGSYNLSDPQSLNRYNYVQNDPVNFVDPSGLNMSAPNTITVGSGYCFFISWVDDGVSTFVGGHCMADPGGGGSGGESGGSVEESPESEQQRQNCDAQLTGDVNVDEMTRYVFAETGGSIAGGRDNMTGGYGEMHAIARVFVNRYNANQARFGGQQFTGDGGVLSRASIAEDGGGSRQFNRAAPDNLSNLDSQECEKYKFSQLAAKTIWDTRRWAAGDHTQLSNEHFWFLGAGAQTPGLRIGASTFYNFDPNPRNRR